MIFYLALCFLSVVIIPKDGMCDDFLWPAYNRTISVKAATLNQNYTEFDTYGLTADGIFDTEKGGIPGWGVQGRWQGKVVGLPLWLQAEYLRLTGQTDYQGYLQGGNTLTPFSARTGNTIERGGLTLGLPLPLTNHDVQFIPYFEISEQRWQRNLVDFGETYRYRGVTLGLLAQWRFSPAWTLEASGQVGRQFDAHINVPAHNFSAELGHAKPWGAGVGVKYQIVDRIGIGANWLHKRWRNQASDIIGGFQEPPSRTRQDNVDVSLDWHY